MTEVVFRRANRGDLEAIIDLLRDDKLGQLREDPAKPLNECYVNAFHAMEDDPNQFPMVASVGDDIVGCLQISYIPGLSHKGMWRGQIESVRIAASQRGTGLGHQMLSWAIRQCEEHGCGMVQVNCDKSRADAIRFYEDLGFKASHEGLKLTFNRG